MTTNGDKKECVIWNSAIDNAWAVWYIQRMGSKRQESNQNKNPHAVALGRLGGLKGGKARFEKLTIEQRREIAQKAARMRWKKNA